jgi:uncharacterized membrane protein
MTPQAKAPAFVRGLMLAFVTIWFGVGGAAHFVFTNAFASIVPDYIPAPRFWVLFTGVCELAGAGAMLAPARLRAMAGLALVMLTAILTLANINMALNATNYPNIGAPMLWLRVAFQPVLMLIIWRATREGP